MIRSGARTKRRLERELTIGPQQLIVFVSLDRREETLACGHVLLDMPVHNHLNPPKWRRCPFHFQSPTIAKMV